MLHFGKSFDLVIENTKFHSVICQVCQQKPVLPALSRYSEIK